MVTYAATKVIGVPPPDAYAYRLDFTNLPSYNPHVSRLRRCSDTSYEFRLRVGPLPVTVRLEVTEAQSPRCIRCRIDAFMPAVEVCEFEPHTDGTLVRFTTTVDSRSGPLRPLVDRLFVVPSGLRQVRRELELMADALRPRPT